MGDYFSARDTQRRASSSLHSPGRPTSASTAARQAPLKKSLSASRESSRRSSYSTCFTCSTAARFRPRAPPLESSLGRRRFNSGVAPSARRSWADGTALAAAFLPAAAGSGGGGGGGGGGGAPGVHPRGGTQPPEPTIGSARTAGLALCCLCAARSAASEVVLLLVLPVLRTGAGGMGRKGSRSPFACACRAALNFATSSASCCFGFLLALRRRAAGSG